jgi:hypothetical protein
VEAGFFVFPQPLGVCLFNASGINWRGFSFSRVARSVVHGGHASNI